MTPPNARSASLEGRTAWVFSDGKAGHVAQCLGVVDALGLTAEVKPVNRDGIYKLMAPWGPVPASEGREALQPPWPAFAFATGRTTIP
ncbi:MAG: ELM1/GtrOC1 family putative glycosyltransferase, partial [Hyphomicrobium sp.]